MDEVHAVEEGERLEDLLRNGLHPRQREPGPGPAVAAVLLKLVQVGPQQLAHQEQVLLHSGPCWEPWPARRQSAWPALLVAPLLGSGHGAVGPAWRPGAAALPRWRRDL